MIQIRITAVFCPKQRRYPSDVFMKALISFARTHLSGLFYLKACVRYTASQFTTINGSILSKPAARREHIKIGGSALLFSFFLPDGRPLLWDIPKAAA